MIKDKRQRVLYASPWQPHQQWASAFTHGAAKNNTTLRHYEDCNVSVAIYIIRTENCSI